PLSGSDGQWHLLSSLARIARLSAAAAGRGAAAVWLLGSLASKKWGRADVILSPAAARCRGLGRRAAACPASAVPCLGDPCRKSPVWPGHLTETSADCWP